MTPLISVCIPSYNNSAYIKETINSVLKQSYSNFELIIVDDCSTDATWEIINSFDDPRIRRHRNDVNLGMHGNWSKALSMAGGEYIKLLCGDDILYPQCLELQEKEFVKPGNEDLALVVCRRKIIKSSGEGAFGSFYKLRPGKYSGAEAIQYCVLFGTNLIGEPMSVLFKGSVFRQHNLALGSNNYLIDLDLYSKLLKYGSIVVLKEYLAAFRIYSTSMSGTLGLKHARMFNEFTHEKGLADTFSVKWYQRFVGSILTYSITIARNIIISFSK